MDWEQLKYFEVTARLEHISRAAEVLNISQSTLSRAIARIETRFGVPLFDRAKRGIRLNAFGRALLTRVEQALLELENAEREIQELSQVVDNQISLGFLSSLGVKIVPTLVRAFQKTRPNARFRLLQGGFELLRERIYSGDIDLCLSSPHLTENRLGWQPLWREELVMLLPPGHRLAARAQIRLAEIASDPVAALREGNGLRADLDRFSREASFTPRIAFEGSDLAPLLGLVGAGIGVALVPKSYAESQRIAKYVRISTPACSRVIGISWNEARFSKSLLRAFRSFLVKFRPPGTESLGA
jgi:DNA-binding transcriptional LysR family regulator